jgi:hypothetical protein
VIRTVTLDVHELSDQVPEAGEVALLFAAKNFMNEQFFVFCLLRVMIITGFIGPHEI